MAAPRSRGHKADAALPPRPWGEPQPCHPTARRPEPLLPTRPGHAQHASTSVTTTPISCSACSATGRQHCSAAPTHTRSRRARPCARIAGQPHRPRRRFRRLALSRRHAQQVQPEPARHDQGHLQQHRVRDLLRPVESQAHRQIQHGPLVSPRPPPAVGAPRRARLSPRASPCKRLVSEWCHVCTMYPRWLRQCGYGSEA